MFCGSSFRWWWWWWLGLLPLLSSHLLPAISLRWHGIVVIIIIIPPSPPPAIAKNHLPSDEDDHEPVLAEITGQTHSQGGRREGRVDEAEEPFIIDLRFNFWDFIYSEGIHRHHPDDDGPPT